MFLLWLALVTSSHIHTLQPLCHRDDPKPLAVASPQNAARAPAKSSLAIQTDHCATRICMPALEVAISFFFRGSQRALGMVGQQIFYTVEEKDAIIAKNLGSGHQSGQSENNFVSWCHLITKFAKYTK